MTIGVAILIPSGIVLAADSRQVIKMASGHLRIDSDNAEKIVQLGPRLAAMVNGQGTIYLNRDDSPQSIGEILQTLSFHLPKSITVKKTVDLISKQVAMHLKRHMAVTNASQVGISFYISGYSQGSFIGELYRCDIPGNIYLERKTNDAGLVWNGDKSIINRLILGYDPRLVDFFPPQNDQNESKEILRHVCNKLQLYINFQTMPLRDAVDLAVILVNTTIELQRFSDGLVGAPGQFPSCGGAVDVAIINQFEGFRWLQHKRPEVRVGGREGG